MNPATRQPLCCVLVEVDSFVPQLDAARVGCVGPPPSAQDDGLGLARVKAHCVSVGPFLGCSCCLLQFGAEGVFVLLLHQPRHDIGPLRRDCLPLPEVAGHVDGEEDGPCRGAPGDPGVDLVVRSLLSVDVQPYYPLAHEAFGPPDEVVLHFQLHHVLDKVAAADIVEGRLDVHEQCPPRCDSGSMPAGCC